jgi:hypothetical protein
MFTSLSLLRSLLIGSGGPAAPPTLAFSHAHASFHPTSTIKFGKIHLLLPFGV